MSKNPRRVAIEHLEHRYLLHAFALDTIADQTVPAGKSILVPITTTAHHGEQISFSASDNSGAISTQFRQQTNSFLKLTVPGYGELVFQLFDDLAPETVMRISGLAKAGYYDGLTFHRVIKDFVVQGGDRAGTGAGPSPFRFNDEFSPDAIFSGNGQLAMANSGKDTNGTQFFITVGAQRFLDFNHTIFGQLVRGWSVLTDINNAPTGANDSPTVPIVISKAEIIENKADAVLQINISNTSSGTVTVTASDGQGTVEQQSFTVTGQTDATNAPPILAHVPDRLTGKNKPLTITLNSTDLENDAVEYAAELEQGTPGSVSVNGNQVTFTPGNNYVGPVRLAVGVKQVGANSRGSSENPYDIQFITIGVGDKPVAAAGRAINAAAGTFMPNTVVATFTDSDPEGTPANWTATIDWGDGNVSPGTIVKNPDGSFSVIGNNEYPAANSFFSFVEIVGDKGATARVLGSTTARHIAQVNEDGVLFVHSSSGDDRIALSTRSGKINVDVNGVVKQVPLASVGRVEIYAYEGHDHVTIIDGVPGTYVDGGAGNDLLEGGLFNDTLTGGAGRNTLYGHAGDDRLNGSGGRDLLFGGEGHDRLYGNGGDDTLHGEGGVDRLFGGAGNDLLIGGSSNDKLYGEAGNDTLEGGRGSDILNGGRPGFNIAINADDDDLLIDIDELLSQ